MKNKFLNFFRKYWIYIVLNIIMVIGFVLSIIFANLYKTGGHSLQFNLNDMYIFVVLPLFSLIYGVLSFIYCKNGHIPLLILYVTAFLCLFVFSIISTGDFRVLISCLILAAYPILFSLFGTIIGILIYLLVRSIKKTI